MKRIVIPCCFHRARKEEQLGFLVRAITNAVWRCSQKNMSLSTLCIAYQKVITLTRFHAKQFFIQTISIHSTACQSASFACKVQIKLNEHFFFGFTVKKFLKLEINISSFKYFRTVMAKNQICSFVFWENFCRANMLLVLSNL